MKKNNFIYLLILVVFLSGCTVKTNDENKVLSSEKDFEDYPYSNSIINIYDVENKIIGELELYHVINQTNDSIIYTKLPKGDCSKITELDYYRYIFETRESIKLGTVKDWSYETNDLVFIDNHLYVLITTNLWKVELCKVTLYDIDLNNNTMGEISSEKSGDPRNAMTAAGKRILMTRIENDGCSLEEYNTETKEIRHLKKYSYDNNAVTGEMIRHISSDNDTISLLVLKMQTEANVSLRVDMYDHSMNFKRSIDLSSISTESNELRQPVSHFNVSKDYIYYENLSATRFLGKIKGNRVDQLMKTDGSFEKAYDLEKNDTRSMYYQAFANKLYQVNETDGSVKQTSFYADDKRYAIIGVSRDSKDNYLVTMYQKSEETGAANSERLYYVKSTELKFE